MNRGSDKFRNINKQTKTRLQTKERTKKNREKKVLESANKILLIFLKVELFRIKVMYLK